MSSKPNLPQPSASHPSQTETNPDYELDDILLERPVMAYYSPLGNDHNTNFDNDLGSLPPGYGGTGGGDGTRSGFRSGSGWPSTHLSQSVVNPFASPSDFPEDKPPSYTAPSTRAQQDTMNYHWTLDNIEQSSGRGTRTADGRKRGRGPKTSTIVAGGIASVVVSGLGAGLITAYATRHGGSQSDTVASEEQGSCSGLNTISTPSPMYASTQKKERK
ncbi:hypothetical protein IAR50_007104 [Cryptococcus sp. DSM 104548]